MTTASDAYKKATNSSAARQATETAKDIGDSVSERVSDFASDVSRKAGKQFDRAKDMAVDAYDEVHEAGVQNPHLSLALAAGLGFVIGMIAARR